MLQAFLSGQIAFLMAFLTDFKAVLAVRVVLEIMKICKVEEGNERAGEEEREAACLRMMAAQARKRAGFEAINVKFLYAHTSNCMGILDTKNGFSLTSREQNKNYMLLQSEQMKQLTVVLRKMARDDHKVQIYNVKKHSQR